MEWERPSVEAQIREAQARGDFDHLPGKGKPLYVRDPDDPDWWVKSLLRREGLDGSAMLHPTILLRREAEGFPQSLADLTREDDVRAVLRDFNARVVAEWRRPASGPSLPVVARPVDVEAMVRRWQDQVDARRRTAEQARPTAEVANRTVPPTTPRRRRWRWWWRR